MCPEALSSQAVFQDDRRGEYRRRRTALPISRRQSLYEWTALTLLLAGPLVGPVLFGTVRVWSIGPLLMMAWIGIALHLARPLLRPDLRLLHIPPGGILWLGFFLYSAILIPFSSVPYEARIELLKVGGYVGAYWAWTDLAARRHRWRILIGLALFLVTLLAWYAVIQHAHGSRMVLNLERPDEYGMRVSGTYFCPNHFANLIALVLPFALVLLCLPSAGMVLRLLSGYTLILLLPVLYLTQSRSGWLAAATGLGLAGILMALRHSRKRFVTMLIVLPLLLAALGAGLWAVSPMVRQRVRGAMIHDPDSAVRARFDVWRDTVPMIAEKPLFGHGPGSYRWVYPRFRTHSMGFLINYAHNEYLHFASDYGLVGLGLLGAVLVTGLGGLLLRLRRVERDKDAYLIAALCGSVAAAAVHAVFDFNLHIYSNNQMLILLAGVTASGLYASGARRPRALRGAGAWLVWGGGLAVVLLLFFVTLRVFVSYGLHHLGETRREKMDMAPALRRLELARAVDRANWRPWLSLGHLHRTRSFWGLDPEQKKSDAALAIECYEAALARNPLDMMALYGLARLQQMLGRPEQALDILREINRMDRNNMFFLPQLGLQLRTMGQDEEALAVFREARSLWSNDMITINIRLLERRLAGRKNVTPPAP
ncbi:MAG: O-antigen ligase family protein [Verrucomicrobia bacterium]|nr:O-antigen ligase family protein [Verrucomicrobiota bacterium]MBU1909009.1 O-antigen ligase family protein [Verrucomicrobiota bacterium]